MPDDKQSLKEALAAYVAEVPGGPVGPFAGHYWIDPKDAAPWLSNRLGISQEESRSRLEAWMEANDLPLIETEDPHRGPAQERHRAPSAREHWRVRVELLGR
jgi:hypothetical protein